MKIGNAFLGRLGGGIVGAGTLGIFGLLSGFMVPLTVIVIRLAHEPVNSDPAGGLLLLLPEAIELLLSHALGLVQGIIGLVTGLVLGFAVGAVGRPDERPARTLVALAMLTTAALGLAIYFGMDITKPVPSALLLKEIQ